MTEEKVILHADFYGDPASQQKGITTGGLYYYILPEEKIRGMKEKNQLVIPPTESVVNVSYFPYLNGDTVLIYNVVFDTKRFPLPNENVITSKTIYRVGDMPFEDVKLGTFKRYNIPAAARESRGLFNWQREGKLFQYPFTRLELNDNISTPLEIKPHLYNNNTNTQAIHVKHAVNNMGMYLLYSPGYKSDSSGLVEGVVSSALNIPTTSNFYMDYMARNQESLKTARNNTVISTVAQTFTGALSGAAIGAKFGSLGGVPGTVIGGVAGGAFGLISGSSSYRQNLAEERDAENSPSTLRSTGGDVLFNMQVSDGKLYAYRYQHHPDVMERIGWFFHLYGYKQNRVLLPNVKNRYYYNYIKTENVNLKSEGIPKEHLLKLRMIYDNGTTIWHADRQGVEIGDYSRDNYEI